jgi:tubulin polyglutamylase TTLL6/13
MQINYPSTNDVSSNMQALKPWQKINHFPGMSEICRKDTLARNLNRMRREFPKHFNFYPKTWWPPAKYAYNQ